MYPLIQEHVWAKVASEEDLLRTVLDTFIRVSVWCVCMTCHPLVVL